MSSSCVLVKQTSSSFIVAPHSRPVMMDTRLPTTNTSYASLWRPWLNGKDAQRGFQRNTNRQQSCPYSRPVAPHSLPSSEGKPQAFQHPVRLFWPKSKSFDYLYSDGEALLRNFPVQATISFYEDSDSEEEDEEEDWEEEGDSDDDDCLKPQSHFTSYN